MPTPGKCPIILAFGSLGLAVAAETVKPGSGLLIATSCNWLSAMVAAPVQKWFCGLFPKPPPEAEEIFHNHDILRLLQRAIENAVTHSCNAYHEEEGNAPDSMRHAGKILAEEVEKAIHDEKHPLAAFHEFDITALLDDFVESQGNAPLLTAAQWLPALTTLPGLVEKERTALAQGLEKHFGHALWGCIKHDAGEDRKTFASIELTYLSEIKKLLLDEKTAAPPGLGEALESRVITLMGEIDEKHTAYFKRLISVADAHETASRERHEEVMGKLHIDPAAATARLRKEIEDIAAKELAKMDAASAAGAEIARIEDIRDRQIADLEEFVARLTRDYESGNAAPLYARALEILLRETNGGIDEALAYLRAKSETIRRNIAASSRALARTKEQVARAEEDLARDLQPLLYQAQLLEQKLAYQAALEIFREAVSLAPHSWEAQNSLGMMCVSLALHKEAETAYTAAKYLAESTENEAASLNNLAALLHATNRHSEAEPLIRRALAIDEGSFGENHPKVAIYLCNLAQLLMATNRLAEAEPLMRRDLAIREANFGKNHPRNAISLNNLAGLLLATNRFDEAEPIMRRALSIVEASYGENHPNVAKHLGNIAQLFKTTNRLAEAEPLMRRALAIEEKSFGASHPAVALDLGNLAQLLQATNRLSEAEPLMRRALAIDEASFGENHSHVATDLNNLAALLQRTNRLAEAEPLMRRALAIEETSYGENHPNVARDYNNLGRLLHETNRLAEAEPFMRRALAISEASLEANHPQLAIVINNLALLLHDTQNIAEAKSLSRRSNLILLRFLKQTGHVHPKSKKHFINYTIILRATTMKQQEIDKELLNLGPEAGWESEEWKVKLKELLESLPPSVSGMRWRFRENNPQINFGR